MRISIIAAIDEKRGIGKDNDLLFKIPEDFERMKNLTMGHPLVMGRKTFESIGRVLPGRTNIIVTQNSKLKIQNCLITHSLEEAIEEAKKAPGNDEIFIFGGGQIFKEAIEKNLVDRLYLTLVQGDYGADTFFPDYSRFDRVIREQSGKSGDYKYKFLDLEKS
ncbi:MAG: dihydrofolate reductase [Patescibacteria group bacterium]